MAKEPWEEDIYDKGEKELTRSKKTSDVVANRVLTILAVIFFIIVITIVGMMIYLSTGGSSKKAATQGFYNTKATSKPSESSSVPESSKATSDSSQTQSSEGTLTVQAGEGEAAIAARAGISIAELERLNPSHMTTGAWYANPGDVVKIR